MKGIRIGIDVMGGDYAPHEAVKAVIELSQNEAYADIQPVLFGNRTLVENSFKEQNSSIDDFEFVHCEDVIGMSEHPTKALSQKRDSSIGIGFKFLAEGKIDSFASAGNTGAMLVGSMYSVKTIPGIVRPTITTIIPKTDGKHGIMLDAGTNADCKPEMLNQFATLGSLYYKSIYSESDNARVGLLNIGEEKEKGNLLTQSTYPLLEANDRINFVGNIEGRDLFSDKADVYVCDGFTGNMILKVCEGLFYKLLKRGVNDEYLNRFNFKHYGGTPILGVNAPVIIGHGISKSSTIIKMIELSKNIVESKMVDKIKSAF